MELANRGAPRDAEVPIALATRNELPTATVLAAAELGDEEAPQRRDGAPPVVLRATYVSDASGLPMAQVVGPRSSV